jgi:hypothetical protein
LHLRQGNANGPNGLIEELLRLHLDRLGETPQQVILLEVLEQDPARLTVDELALRIVADPSDRTEVETATTAVRDLRRACLVRYRNDDLLVEPTQAALRMHALWSLA